MDVDDRIQEIPTARAGWPTCWQDREAVGRRIGVGLLVLVLVAAALGVLGPRDASRSSESGDLAVTYPTITRPGLDSSVVVTIRPGADADRHLLRAFSFFQRSSSS